MCKFICGHLRYVKITGFLPAVFLDKCFAKLDFPS